MERAGLDTHLSAVVWGLWVKHPNSPDSFHKGGLAETQKRETAVSVLRLYGLDE